MFSREPAELTIQRGILDAHTHVFSPEVCANWADYCDRDPWFGSLYGKAKARLATIDDLIESMNGSTIGGAILCGFPWQDPGLCRAHNDYMADCASRFPDRVRWLASVSSITEIPGRLERDLVDAVARGACGFGELNGDAQGFELDRVSWVDQVARFSRDARLPIMFHVSEPLGHDYPGKGASWPQKTVPFLERFPGLTVVAAHWGGGLPFYELMPEVKAAAMNTVYDSAASTYLYDFRVFRTVLDLVGERRVLFGSDYPVLGQKRFLERTERISWRSTTEREMVLGGNARRLFVNPRWSIE